MDYAQSKKLPGVLEVNAPLIAEQALHRILVNRPQAEWVAHRVFGNATALIAVSQEVARFLRQYPNADGRVHILPNGVNPARFPAGVMPSYHTTAGSFTIGFVGTLKPWHGLESLVRAFDQIYLVDPTVRLLIVGDGPLRSALEADLTQRGLRDAAHFTGAVDPTEIPGLLASMDVAVAPYSNLPDFYFSPLKVYEYMAAGRAVVASRIGQLEELIEPEVSGLLCRPGDHLELAGALLRLRRDAALRDRLGRVARQIVMQQHTWDSIVLRILRLAGMAAHDRRVPGLGAA